MRKSLLVGLAVAAPILFASGASACGWGCGCAPSYGYSSYGYSAPRVYGYSSYYVRRTDTRYYRRRALLWCADVRLAWRSGRPQSGMARRSPLVVAAETTSRPDFEFVAALVPVLR